MNESRIIRSGRKPATAARPGEEETAACDRGSAVTAVPAAILEALDDQIAIVGTAGSGKTNAAKGFVERLLASGARIAIVDPLGVWWGLRASADGAAPGYPVVVFGGRHADVPITAEMAAALGRLIAGQALACVVDLSDLGSSAARRRFMAAFAEALYETNEEPLHLVLDEADLWAPQRPIKGWEGLLGHIEEIVRRGRVRGFIPWLITQRPAVVHKDVLSQADILIAMKLTASQDRDAIGAWIEGQADRQEGKRILGELPRLKQGEGYLWAPGHGILHRVRFPAIRTFDSSRTPKRGERLAVPRTLADVDLTAIVAALSAAEIGATDKAPDGPTQRTLAQDEAARRARLEQELTAAKARIVTLEEENRALASRLAEIAALASGSKEALPISETRPPHSPRVGANAKPSDGPHIEGRGGLHPAALSDAGCSRIYEEKISSASRNRPELARLLDHLRDGDLVVVYRLDRLARSTRDLLDIAELIKEAEAGLRSLSEPWADTTSPAGRMVLTVFAGIAEFERALIHQRTGAGRTAARARGVQFGRPPKLTAEHVAVARRLIDEGTAVREAARILNVHAATLYRALGTVSASEVPGRLRRARG